jgi:hypothetical protein
MAITKIAGELLESNLIRTTDLAFNTNLLVVDVDNGRVGVGTATPGNFKLDVVGDTRITGDLTVTGTTTTIDSQNLSIEDNMIVLNSSGSIGNDSGLMINRGAAGNNAVFFWDEDADKFKVGTTTNDGSTQTDFGSATLAKLQIGEPAADSDASTKKYVDDELSTVSSSISSDGGDLTLGLPTDSSFGDGSYTLNNAGSVTDAIDDLNEVQENIRLSQYVKSVTYTRTPAAGSLGMTVTLAITVVGGGATRYTVNWGDGTTETVSATNPTHDYDENSGTPYTITVKAYNHVAVTDSSGSFANSGDSMTNLTVTVYTSTPVVSFEFYAASSGGSALTGNNLWAVEGGTRYLRNTSTNTSGATVVYSMAWGDGSGATAIANDSASGGVSGTRLSHAWGAGTNSSTGRDTLTLSLTTHSTCNPALLPITGTISLKVYDDLPSGPDDIGDKTIAMNAVVGISPKLCSGFSENVSGSPTYAAGNAVNRVTTVDPVRTASQSTWAYNAAAGTLTAYVNGSASGAISLSGSDNSGTATNLTIESENDFQLLNSTGAAVAFNSSIYFPTHFSGHKSIVTKATSGISTGVNSFQIQSTSPSSVQTNTLEFVKDNITATPTVTGVGTLAEGSAGTYRYISGIPYYSEIGSAPSLTLAGVTVTNLTGQCYSDVANPVEVIYDSRIEGSSDNAIGDLDFTYAIITDGSTAIPAVNLGVSSALTLATLTIPITTTNSAVCVNEIKIMARNCNGTGSYNTSSTTKVQVYNDTTPNGLDNEAGGIAVADALGATYDDDAVRVSGFGSLNSDNPDISDSSNANYYTDSAWSGAVPVAGTNEAICRFGTIGFNILNYSSGYLPAGPNLTTGRDGGQKQYYTFAFRRATVSQFSITMTGTVSGMWIKLPDAGTDATSSATNGWLDCSTQYGGSGVPGANTGAGGNGSAGVAKTGGDRVIDNTGYSSEQFTFTLGTESMTNSRGNNCLVRILLNSGDSITALSVGQPE